MPKRVAFAKNLAVAGVVAGLTIALVVPFLAFLAAGWHVIPSGGAVAITIISVLAGAPVVLVSAFFGVVIPSSVEESDHERHGHHRDKWHKQEKDEVTKGIQDRQE